MKYFYLYIFGLVVFIIGMSYYNTLNTSFYREGFGITNYVLLGDSILNNSSYVSNGENIAALLQKKNPDGKVLCLATDGAKISNIPPQISSIPSLYNDSNTIIFLSVGGNDILNNTHNPDFDTMLEEYNKLIESIKIVAPEATLYLVDLYFPRNKDSEQYWQVITEWNNKLTKYASDNNVHIFNVSSILTKPEDFTGIEPSSIGGQKMVDYMIHQL